tara:strand:+ start:1083 stop:1544 length:462 start_codon:yes stop_codon:yes gene_type:complete
MLDYFLYKLVITDYLPFIMEYFPEHYQESLFVIPDEDNINYDSYTWLDTINPVKQIADSRYSRIIELILIIILSIYSVYISNKCKGPGKSMYIIFSLLFPISHFIILNSPKILPNKLGKMIGCDFEEIKKKQESLDKIREATANIKGGKYRRK